MKREKPRPGRPAMFDAIRRCWFPCLLAVYVCYALAFIVRTSTVVDGRRYFLLLDDAMISMTYAKNLAAGHGAVWWPGAEAVEGYSNPLWMLYMAAVHRLPLPPRLMSLPVQLTGMLLVIGTLFFVKAIAERLAADPSEDRRQTGPRDAAAGSGRPMLAPFLAVLLTAFYYPLNNWTLRGMEVGLLAFGVCLAVWAAMRCRKNQRCPWWLMPFLGLLTTVRMDAAVVGVVVLAWLVWNLPAHRRQTLIAGLAWLALFLVVQSLVRRAYYHDWLPNTYYLKLAGVPLGRRLVWGLYVLFHFLAGMGLWLVALVAWLAVAVRSRTVWLILALVAAQACYSIYVGGDAWEFAAAHNRYLCIVMPLWFIAVALGLAMVGVRLAAFQPNPMPRRTGLAVCVVGLLVLVQVNSYQFTGHCSTAQSAAHRAAARQRPALESAPPGSCAAQGNDPEGSHRRGLGGNPALLL